jgi:hypothetical protein
MTPLQILHDEFKGVFFPSQAQSFWLRHKAQLPNASIILSCPGPSPFVGKVLPLVGKNAHVVCAFADDRLCFLNQRLSSDAAQGKGSHFSIAYMMCFDTNAASHLRALVAGRESPQIKDLRALLAHFGGNRLNWQINPYLLENNQALDRAEVLETLVAVETIGAIDSASFFSSGKIGTKITQAELITLAQKRLSHFRQGIIDGKFRRLFHVWNTVHVILLYMALIQLKWPGVRNAELKLKALVRFMDEELHCLAMFMLAIAAQWFYADPRARILQPLQSRSPHILRKVRNIAWDIFHLIHLPNESSIVPPPASFLIPYFLTFDCALSSAMKVCGARSMLIKEPGAFPLCIPATPIEPILNHLTAQDESFLNRYLSVDAAIRRQQFGESGGLCDFSKIACDLEKKLSEPKNE